MRFFVSAFETTFCVCRPRRFIPSARIWLRRIPEEIALDVILNEAADPLLDYVINTVDARAVFAAVIFLILFAAIRRNLIVK